MISKVERAGPKPHRASKEHFRFWTVLLPSPPHPDRFSVLSYLLISFLLLPSMNHGEHLGLEFDDLDAPHYPRSRQGRWVLSRGERAIGNQGTSLRVHEQGDIPAPVTGSSEVRLSGLGTSSVSGQACSQSVANPYPTTSNPSQLSASGNGLMPWTMLPSMHTNSNTEPTLSFVTKKPKITEVIPGHSPNPFTSREYDPISTVPQKAVRWRSSRNCGPWCRWTPGCLICRGWFPLRELRDVTDSRLLCLRCLGHRVIRL